MELLDRLTDKRRYIWSPENNDTGVKFYKYYYCTIQWKFLGYIIIIPNIY